MERQKIYIVQHTESMMILGCFGTKKDAKKYANKSVKLFIIEAEVCSYVEPT